MVLLDLFADAAAKRKYELTVAHFDHGLRSDSGIDHDLVQAVTAQRGHRFESSQVHLKSASEATARTARHTWLEQIRRKHSAVAILTAHHQDDLLETSLLNLARGSGRIGLAPMATSATILRPLLNLTRPHLRAYAAEHDVVWHEDSTNANDTNPRNFLRHQLLPSATPAWRKQYLSLITRLTSLNAGIDQTLREILEPALANPTTYTFPIDLIRTLTLPEIEELLLAAARRLQPGIQLDHRLITEIARFAQTGQPHKFRPLRNGLILSIARISISLTTKSLH